MPNWIINQVIDLTKLETVDLKCAAPVLSQGNGSSHIWRVKVMNDGAPASLSGYSAVAYFERQDGTTVAVTATKSGNTVSVSLESPVAAYAGTVKGTLDIIKSGEEITIAAVSFIVRNREVGEVIAVDSSGHIITDRGGEIAAVLGEVTRISTEIEEVTSGLSDVEANANEAKRLALYDKEIITQYVADTDFAISTAKDEVVHVGAYDSTKPGWLVESPDFGKIQPGQYKFQTYGARKTLTIRSIDLIFLDSQNNELGAGATILSPDAENVTLTVNTQYNSDIFYVSVPTGAASAYVRILDDELNSITDSDLNNSGSWANRQRMLPVYGMAVKSNQGTANAGKALVVGDDGLVTVGTASGGGTDISYDQLVEKGQVEYAPRYTNNAVSSSTGQQGAANDKFASTPGLYFVPEYCRLFVDYDSTEYQTTVYCFAEDQTTFLGYVPTSSVIADQALALPSGTRYVRFYVTHVPVGGNRPDIYTDYPEGTEDPDSVICALNAHYICKYAGAITDLESNAEQIQASLDRIVVNNNMLVGEEPIPGYYNGHPNTSESALANYKYFEKIPVQNGVTYKSSPAARMIYIMDSNEQVINYTNESSGVSEITAEGDGFAYISYANANVPAASFSVDNSEDVYPRDQFALSDSVIVPDILSGKKWAVLGDSFTNGVSGNVKILDKGKYAGQKAVYPYIIGNKTNMDIVSFFLNGRTLAFPASPGTFANSITNSNAACYYQNIPDDVDYITIYLGINDSHHAPGSSGGDGEDNTGEIPLGSITDTTVTSFYGAWNVVLPWLIENRPNAHIGIIVSNGCENDNYRLATIEVAKKHGIPYIDLNGDERTPAMIRSTNPNVAESVKLLLRQKWAVSSSNTHPNDAAHEYESTFIESFLRSI